MNTIRLSPARRAGLNLTRHRPTAGSATIPIACGRTVVDVRDVRHTARLDGYPGGNVASVTFDGSGHKGEIPLPYLDLARNHGHDPVLRRVQS